VRHRRRPVRPSERGFALALAVIVAVLYFALIELLMIDASRDLAQARQFRAHVIAQTLAENAVELAALQIFDPGAGPLNVNEEDWQGKMLATRHKSLPVIEDPNAPPPPLTFTLKGSGETAGLVKARAAVTVQGRIEEGKVLIDYTNHAMEKAK
jgi:hypothetical protein